MFFASSGSVLCFKSFKIGMFIEVLLVCLLLFLLFDLALFFRLLHPFSPQDPDGETKRQCSRWHLEILLFRAGGFVQEGGRMGFPEEDVLVIQRVSCDGERVARRLDGPHRSSLRYCSNILTSDMMLIVATFADLVCRCSAFACSRRRRIDLHNLWNYYILFSFSF